MIFIGFTEKQEQAERRYLLELENTVEEWRRVYINGKTYNYEVSNTGKIRNYKNKKILKLHENNSGYLLIEIWSHGKSFTTSIHRLVATAFIPIPYEYINKGYNYDTLQVNHKDGNKRHNLPYNLEWSTQQENMDHAWNTGLRLNCYGENFSSSNVKTENVIKVCELLELGQYSSTEISMMTGVGYETVRNIRAGKAWKHISKNYKFKRAIESVPFKIDDETFHKICKDIEDCELKNKEIGEKYGISPTYIPLIRNGNIRPEISSQYDFKKNMKKRMSKKDNDELIHMICASLQHGMKPTEIQKKYPDFKLSLSFISEIKNGKLRRDISKGYDI